MRTPNGLAREAVAALEAGDHDTYCGLLTELERKFGSGTSAPDPLVRDLLIEAGVALAYLKQAAQAAHEGREEDFRKYYRKACVYVGQSEAITLAEEHRLSFIITRPVAEPSFEVRHGFAPA